MDRWVENFVLWLIKWRFLVLSIALLATVFCGYNALKIKTYDDPNKWPPKDDKNVILNDFIQEKFGGANVVTVQITVKEGTIFNQETLGKVKRISDKILKIYGVVPSYLTSLAALKVRYMKGTDDFLDVSLLMPEVPRDEGKMERLKYGVYHNPTIYRSIVSEDSKSTVIIADFRTGFARKSPTGLFQTTPDEIYRQVNECVEAERDENHVINMAGSPIIIGWVNTEGMPYIFLAFGGFLIVVALVLAFSFRRKTGMLAPLALGIVSVIWAFGIYVLVYGDLIKSSSAYIAPFIIMAATACHSVQFLTRFFEEEYQLGKEKDIAIISTVSNLYKPIIISVVTDAMGFVVCMLVPFENVSILGAITAFGLLAVLVNLLIFFIPLLSILPMKVHKVSVHEASIKVSQVERITKLLVRKLIYPTKGTWVVIGLVIVLAMGCFIHLFHVSIGQDNTYAIHNFLTRSWKGNEIYEMEVEMKKKFKGIYPLNILIETDAENGLQKPEILQAMDNMAEDLKRGNSHIAGVSHLPTFIKVMNRTIYSEDDNYFTIPDAEKTIGEYLYLYGLGEPGSFETVVNYRYDKAVMTLYLDSSAVEVVDETIGKAEKYIKETFNNVEGVKATLAAGTIGIADAFNKNIKKWLILTTFLSALFSYLCILILMRSFSAGFYLLLPLFISVFIFITLAEFLGIEINSNITSAMAIAFGVGIDAEIYFLYRFKEELKAVGDFKEALMIGFTKIRGALIFSHVALILGCWSLVPIPLYVGYVGFGMGMIVLLCFVISFIISPFLWSVIKPRFLAR